MQTFSNGRIDILMYNQPFGIANGHKNSSFISVMIVISTLLSGSFSRREPRNKAGEINAAHLIGCLWIQLCGLPPETLMVVAGEYSERPRVVATAKETFTTLFAKLSRFSLSSRCKRKLDGQKTPVHYIIHPSVHWVFTATHKAIERYVFHQHNN